VLQTAVRAAPTGRYRMELFAAVLAFHYPSNMNDGRHMRGGNFGVVSFGA